ncbi:hypothetical protein C0Q70_00105 [Pomacea canaliculata]|uniref:Uncharacterized protein n=1 Tax=Pomacea canaliculata TaxID=400727 RepID=A0A2T7PVS1_POMCA|nr:hypothetical protein C0Q70_00105 [Pomacea canaliculata]
MSTLRGTAIARVQPPPRRQPPQQQHHHLRQPPPSLLWLLLLMCLLASAGVTAGQGLVAGTVLGNIMSREFSDN